MISEGNEMIFDERNAPVLTLATRVDKFFAVLKFSIMITHIRHHNRRNETIWIALVFLVILVRCELIQCRMSLCQRWKCKMNGLLSSPQWMNSEKINYICLEIGSFLFSMRSVYFFSLVFSSSSASPFHCELKPIHCALMISIKIHNVFDVKWKDRNE